jgi:AcrR family transcriptional regulator
MTSKRSKPLTRDEIFSAALAIVDADGIDALSMRRLARELGVEAMSLYHHVPNKAALLDGVVELSLAAQAPQAPLGDAWQDIVTGAVCGFRRALVAHPNVLPMIVAHPPTSKEQSAVYIEGPLRFLVANGFPDRDASELFEAVFALSFGHAMLSTNYPAITPEGAPPVDFTEESFERTVRVLLDGYAEQSGVEGPAGS